MPGVKGKSGKYTRKKGIKYGGFQRGHSGFKFWKGKKFSKEHIENLKKSHKGQDNSRFKGANNYSWRGGITPINQKIRGSAEYKLWRSAVIERDKFTCIWCGGKERLQADHIKPFSLFPELRFAIDNGRTLCFSCHTRTETWGWKLQSTKSYGIYSD